VDSAIRCAVVAPAIDTTFPHYWRAEILSARPAILPARRYVYPRDVEEVERGALEVLVHPQVPAQPGCPRSVASGDQRSTEAFEAGAGCPRSLAPGDRGRDSRVFEARGELDPQPFLATCALGFRDPAAPTGVWSAPNPRELCAIAGGYAYVIDTAAPERFTMIEFRPVLAVRPAPEHDLLLFVGHRSILAWGHGGLAWQSEKLSDEGVTITGIDGGVLRGMGWKMTTDKETPFAIDMKTGRRIAAEIARRMID